MSIAHRGPDGQGLIVDGPVGFAHRRLAIVDVMPAAQPMCNEDGSIWIVFNGEIYNHADAAAGPRGARPSLSHRAATPKRSSTCTKKKASASSSGLHGMFAFAIWDRPQQRLLLARDRLGIKPLYYARHRQRAAVRIGDQGDPRGRRHPAAVQRGRAAGVSRRRASCPATKRSSTACASCFRVTC